MNDLNLNSSIDSTVSTKNERNFDTLNHEVILTHEQCSGTRDNYLYAFGMEDSEELQGAVTEGDCVLG